jgi:hypothetical protein
MNFKILIMACQELVWNLIGIGGRDGGFYIGGELPGIIMNELLKQFSAITVLHSCCL